MKLVVVREFVILKEGKFLVKRQIKDKKGNIRNTIYVDMTKEMRRTNRKLI